MLVTFELFSFFIKPLTDIKRIFKGSVGSTWSIVQKFIVPSFQGPHSEIWFTFWRFERSPCPLSCSQAKVGVGCWVPACWFVNFSRNKYYEFNTRSHKIITTKRSRKSQTLWKYEKLPIWEIVHPPLYHTGIRYLSF